VERGEQFNTITHLIGATLALAGLVLLVVFASLQGDPWMIVSFSVYGFTLFTLYLVSTLYHGLNGKAKSLFHVFDHQAIYLLIAGTYTPFTLVTLKGGWGWSIFGVIWGVAIFGLVLDALPVVRKGRRILPVVIYVLMGWIIVIALTPLMANLSGAGFLWLLLGGISYTVGIVFYALSSRYTYAHGIWHLFVLSGSICHFFSILFHVK
jgi:hemolysin III